MYLGYKAVEFVQQNEDVVEASCFCQILDQTAKFGTFGGICLNTHLIFVDSSGRWSVTNMESTQQGHTMETATCSWTGSASTTMRQQVIWVPLCKIFLITYYNNLTSSMMTTYNLVRKERVCADTVQFAKCKKSSKKLLLSICVLREIQMLPSAQHH